MVRLWRFAGPGPVTVAKAAALFSTKLPENVEGEHRRLAEEVAQRALIEARGPARRVAAQAALYVEKPSPELAIAAYLAAGGAGSATDNYVRLLAEMCSSLGAQAPADAVELLWAVFALDGTDVPYGHAKRMLAADALLMCRPCRSTEELGNLVRIGRNASVAHWARGEYQANQPELSQAAYLLSMVARHSHTRGDSCTWGTVTTALSEKFGREAVVEVLADVEGYPAMFYEGLTYRHAVELLRTDEPFGEDGHRAFDLMMPPPEVMKSGLAFARRKYRADMELGFLVASHVFGEDRYLWAAFARSAKPFANPEASFASAKRELYRRWDAGARRKGLPGRRTSQEAAPAI